MEYSNLLDEKQRLENEGLRSLLKATEVEPNDYMEKEVLKLMEQFDIQHYFRGERFEGKGKLTQKFSKKIMDVAGDPSTFLNYKKDKRQVLETSKIHSEKYVAQQKERRDKMRMILRYKLFGIDGVSRFEFYKLIRLGVIKRKPDLGTPNFRLESASNCSRSSHRPKLTEEQKYQRDLREYDVKTLGDTHFGFKILPLDPEIFGEEAVAKQRAKM